MVKVTPLAAPQLAPCAPSARAWRLWAARHSQSEARPLTAQPLPRGLERAASKVADFTAFDHPGSATMTDGQQQWVNTMKSMVSQKAGKRPQTFPFP